MRLMDRHPFRIERIAGLLATRADPLRPLVIAIVYLIEARPGLLADAQALRFVRDAQAAHSSSARSSRIDCPTEKAMAMFPHAACRRAAFALRVKPLNLFMAVMTLRRSTARMSFVAMVPQSSAASSS